MKPDCLYYEKLLWEYSEGTLSPSQKSTLEQHLTKCENCKIALNTIQLLRESSRENLDEISNKLDASQFDNEVMYKIARAREQKYAIGKSTYVYRLGLSFAAAAVIVFFLLLATSEIKLFMPGKEALDSVTKDEFIIFQMQTQSDSSFRLSKSEDAQLKGKLSAPPVLSAPPESLTMADEAIGREKDDSQNKALEAKIKKNETASFVGLNDNSDQVKSEAETRHDTMPVLSSNDSVRIFAETSPRQGSAREADKVNIPLLPLAPDAGSNENRISFESGIINTQTTTQSLLVAPLAKAAPESLKVDGIYIVDRTNYPQIKSIISASLKNYAAAYAVLDSIFSLDTLVIAQSYPRPKNFVLPSYPLWAKKQRQSGLVWALLKVEPDGTIKNPIILGSNNEGFEFENSVIDAALISTFYPGNCGASPCPIWIAYSVKFIFSK